MRARGRRGGTLEANTEPHARKGVGLFLAACRECYGGKSVFQLQPRITTDRGASKTNVVAISPKELYKL